MFRIIGDMIEYEYRPFARIVDGLGATFRDQAESMVDRTKGLAEIELEHEKEMEEADNAHATEILAVEEERDALEETLRALEGGYKAHELVAEARSDAAKWREIAETNRKAYYDLLAVVEKRKARKPR